MDYNGIIKNLEEIINENHHPGPSIDELFKLEASFKITDHAYYGRADGLGTKLLKESKELKENTELIEYEDIKVQRGKEKSDYSFTTNNDSYTFKRNGLILKVNLFTPRSRNKVVYNFICEG